MTKEQRTKQLKRRYTIGLATLSTLTITSIGIFTYNSNAKNVDNSASANATIEEQLGNYECAAFETYYAIYDCYQTLVNDETGLTELTVDINGEFHIFAIEDAPEDTEIHSVCLEINSDDVTTWKVVAVK